MKRQARVGSVVVILAKWPRSGRAKRRLAEAIGTRRATVLARSFLRDTLVLAQRSGARRVLIAYAPASARARFAALDGAQVLKPQGHGSFGARLRRALAAGLTVGERVVLIGTDSPTLRPSVLRSAFAKLRTADAVLGPAEDGGYYLIGTRTRLPNTLFEGMPWSTASVAAETLRRAAERELQVERLASWYDIDDASSLQRLVSDRAGLRRAHATRAALKVVGLLS
jgi:rSAM/selenodomain-associated transferase 1